MPYPLTVTLLILSPLLTGLLSFFVLRKSQINRRFVLPLSGLMALLIVLGQFLYVKSIQEMSVKTTLTIDKSGTVQVKGALVPQESSRQP